MAKDEEVLGRLQRGVENEFAYIRIPAELLEALAARKRSLGTTTVTLEEIARSGTSGASGAQVRRVAGVETYEAHIDLAKLAEAVGTAPLRIMVVQDQHSKNSPVIDDETRYRTIVDKVYAVLAANYQDKLAIARRAAGEGDIRTKTVGLTPFNVYLDDERVSPNAKSLVFEEINRRRLTLNTAINETLHADEKDFLQEYWARKLLPFFEGIDEVTVDDIKDNYHAYRVMKAFGFYNREFKEDLTRFLGFKENPTVMITVDAVASNWFVDQEKIAARLAESGDQWIDTIPFDVDDIIRIDLERLMLGIEQQDYSLLRMTAAGVPMLGHIGFIRDGNALMVARYDQRCVRENIDTVAGVDAPHQERAGYKHSLGKAEWYETVRLMGAKIDRATAERKADNITAIQEETNELLANLGLGLRHLVCNRDYFPAPQEFPLGKEGQQIEYLNRFLQQQWMKRLIHARNLVEVGEAEKARIESAYQPLQFQ